MRTRLLLLALASLLPQAAQAQTSPPVEVVDLMVVYTPQALSDAGGEARIHAQIEAFVAEANRCFSNSQINARFHLVHRGVVPYTESGDWSTDRSRLRTPGDGYLDDVHLLRNLYKADLVMLHVWGTAAVSLIYNGDSGNGFSVIGRHPALTMRWLPTHELAHNFGPLDRVMPTSSSERLANRFVAEGILYRTIVSYDPGIPVPYLSGTNVLYQGVPTGTTAADSDVRLMNQNAPSISRFRVATNRFEFTAERDFAPENVGTAMVQVVRTGDTNTSASIDVHIMSGTAQAGTDFIAQTNRLTFSPGVETLACPVTILDDAVCKGERTVLLSLQPPPGDATYTATQGNALGRQDNAELVIQDDDPGFVLGATNGVVSETSGAVTLNVRRVGDITQTGSVAFATSDGTALAGVNYLATNGILSFAAGEAERFVAIPILNDAVPGDDRAFTVALVNPGPGTGLGHPDSAMITILDNQRPGSLDAAFNPAGGPNRPVSVVAVRRDGRLLCAGQFTRFNGLDHAGLVQLNPDGSVDTDFHPVRIAVGPDREDGEVYGNVSAIAEQSDGRILVGGEFPTVNGVRQPNLFRFNADGTLDTDFRPAVNGRILRMALQPDGKIVLGGCFTEIAGQWHPMVARLNPNGSLDPSFQFSVSGFVQPTAVILQPDGKILVSYYNGSFVGMCMRLNSNGTRDTGFQQPALPTWSAPNTLAILPNGQILMGGDFRTVNGRARPLLARLNPDGTLDESFATPFDLNGYVISLAPLPDGRLLVAGMLSVTNTPGRQSLIRLNADGSWDRSFNAGAGPNDFVFAASTHASGSLYLGGAFVEVNGRPAPYLARVRCDGLSFDRPLITVQPTNQLVRPGTNATFNVSAYSITPITYQWRRNGAALPDATNTFLTFTNVTLEHEGTYDVIVTDSLGATTSAAAGLFVLIQPVITQPPLSQDVVVGGRVTLSVAITGNPAPFLYQWRRGSTILANIVQHERVCFLTLTNVLANQGGSHRICVTNAASPNVTTVNTTFTLTVLADTDADGLPDTWEAAYGLSTNDAADAALDLDGDGRSNLEECRAGTDPTNAASVLRVEPLEVLSQAVRLRFSAVSNRTYTVLGTATLEASFWQRVTDVLAAETNRLVEVLEALAVPNASRYFRLVTPRAP